MMSVHTRKKKTLVVDTMMLPFSALSAAQWQDLAAIEAEAHIVPWSLEALKQCADERHTAVAALIHNQVAGYIILMHNMDEWELLNITVAPELQELGLGKQLLNLGLSAAQNAGVPHVLLELRPSNLPAMALYRRSGFVNVGLRKAYYRTDVAGVMEDAVLMRCAVTSPSSTTSIIAA